MTVVNIPDVEETIHAGQVEDTGAGRGPATISKVTVVVSGLHNGLLDFFRPNLGGPITDSKEIFKMGGISLHRVDRTVMTTTFHSVSSGNFSLLSPLSLDDVTLLGTNHVLHGGSICVVVEASTAKNLGRGTFLAAGVSQL